MSKCRNVEMSNVVPSCAFWLLGLFTIENQFRLDDVVSGRENGEWRMAMEMEMLTKRKTLVDITRNGKDCSPSFNIEYLISRCDMKGIMVCEEELCGKNY